MKPAQKIPERFRPFLTQDQYDAILEIIFEFIQKRGSVNKIQDGVLFATLKNNDRYTFGLDNIIRYCLQEPDRSKWPPLIERHFSIIIKTPKESERKILTLEELKSLVCVRIYPEQYVQDKKTLQTMICQTDLEGTRSMVVLDYPDHFQMLLKKDIESLHISEKEVFALGLRNLQKQPFELIKKTVFPGAEVFIIQNKEYAGSMILCLAHLDPKFIGTSGSLIAIPSKDRAMIFPLQTKNFKRIINAVDDAVLSLFMSSPGPITPNYYRYQKGSFKKV